MPSLRQHTTFFRASELQHYYCNDSAIRHLAIYGRLSLYDWLAKATVIRKSNNIFVIPLEVEERLFANRPWSYRTTFLNSLYEILRSIPPHLPLHLDFNDYPELFI